MRETVLFLTVKIMVLLLREGTLAEPLENNKGKL